MGARAIHGKPGSGKSCYAVHLIVLMLADWARYKKKRGKEFGRKLYTNIPLYVDKINEYLSKELGFTVDLSSQIVLLDDAFFTDKNGNPREWWEDFPEAAFIVIDEFQYLLSANSKKTKDGLELTEKFMLYISKHRHRSQDLILMSQSVKNISVEARRQFEVIYSIHNIKNMTAGKWPFTMPMQDIDIVRESWGMQTQLAHVKRGVFEDEKAVYDKTPELFVLRPALYRLYRSVTLSGEALDRPSMELSRLGSILWLTRRHGLRLGFWTITSVCLLWGGWNVATNLPSLLYEGLTGGMASSEPQGGTPENVAASIPLIPEPLPEKAVEDDKITGLLRGAVITPRGVLRQGDEIVFDGEKDTVSSVDFGKGIIYLGSGKKVHK